MAQSLKQAADFILHSKAHSDLKVPGVVAMATDRDANIYEGAAGRRAIGSDLAMTTDTVMCIFSCTKSITGVTLMQLVEEGKVKLSDAAKDYVPEIAKIQVLEGFDDKGQPKTRPPKSDITLNQLMLHTSGLGYEFFSHDILKYITATNTPSLITSEKRALFTPMTFDPGEGWQYGINIDWVGQVVEAVRGKRLGAVMKEHIFDPLGMQDTGFVISPDMQRRLAKIHNRAEDGALTANDLVLPQDGEVHNGGHGLYSTIGDYMKYVRMILNDGAGPHGRVLKPETVEAMAKDGLNGRKITKVISSIPALSHDAEFFPGMPKSWGYTYMINDEDAPTGRPAGSLAWAGLANLYYWIDRKTGVGGMWGTQILPFADPTSVGGYLDFETAVYKSLHS
jgi:methyl acetate hydrolase